MRFFGSRDPSCRDSHFTPPPRYCFIDVRSFFNSVHRTILIGLVRQCHIARSENHCRGAIEGRLERGMVGFRCASLKRHNFFTDEEVFFRTFAN
jgi:hypothetical protein